MEFFLPFLYAFNGLDLIRWCVDICFSRIGLYAYELVGGKRDNPILACHRDNVGLHIVKINSILQIAKQPAFVYRLGKITKHLKANGFIQIVRERSYNKYFNFRVILFQTSANMNPAAARHFNIQEGDICIAFHLQKIVSAGVGGHFGQKLSYAFKKFSYIFL